MDYDSDETIIIDSDDEEAQAMDDGDPMSDPFVLNIVSNEDVTTTEQAAPLVLCSPFEEKPKEPAVPTEEQPSTAPQKPHDVSLGDDDGLTCPICLDSWTNYGDHRVIALKCGHLFGLSCVLRWFSQKQNTCPTCKKKATRSHIRNIYARRLVALDTSEYENIKKQLDEVTQNNMSLQIEITRGVCREHVLLQKVEDLKKQVDSLSTRIEVNQRFSQTQNESGRAIRLYMDKSLEVCKDAGCRVLDYYIKHDLIVASAKSPNPLFSGFGIRKINISTYKPTTFIPLHSKSIRDLSFHPQNPWLLSVSLDKTVKIVDITSNLPISGFTKGEAPLWACCWDLNNSNVLYVGSQQGAASKFDLRQMNEPLETIDVPGDKSPVVSLAPLSARGGIILCKLNSLWVFENESKVHMPLPMEGPFISMKYQNDTKHLLLSTRSNSHYSHSRHLVCTIETGTENNLLCNVVHCYPGSMTQTYMSRSCFASDKSDNYVVAHQESNKCVHLWSVSNGQRVSSLPAHDPVLDLCSFGVGNDNYIVTLTEKKMEFFKFA